MLYQSPENPHLYLTRPVWAQWADWALHWLPLFFATIYNPLSALICPVGPNGDRWSTLKTSTENTFPVFVTYVGPVGRMVIPLASPIFCGFFEKIHDPLKAIHSPLWQNVNSWNDLGASRELTFPLSMTCVSTKGRMGIPLAAPIFCGFFLDHSRPSQCNTLSPRFNI